MKILAIHNFHRKGSASGDDQVFLSETKLLKQHGHDIIKYTLSNDEFDNLRVIGKVIATLRMLWNSNSYKKVDYIVKKEKPDVVHIHTFFPLMSPSILYAAKKNGIPVVATLHDTRFICPCATSLKGTKLCNECGDGHYFRMLKNKCFKNSILQSTIVAFIFKFHRKRKSFYNLIDKYICLNDNQIALIENVGFESNKIVKKYNFVPEVADNTIDFADNSLPKRYVVFYGRIGEEKGIHILMKVWNRIPDVPLVVMGTGPLDNEFKEWAVNHSMVYYLGYVQHDKCLAIVKNAEFVIFPSIWYEGCSMVEIETESLGKGIIATDLGFSAECIQNGYNGYKVKLGDIDGFVNKIYKVWSDVELCIRIGRNARIDYEKKYRPEDNYIQLMDIYYDAINK